jgi:hypothetical protein
MADAWAWGIEVVWGVVEDIDEVQPLEALKVA